MTARLGALALLLLAGLGGCSEAPDAVDEPARATRIVTLAPNLAELVFAAGAGELLVGVSAYSDYPPEVRELPVVGDAFMIDQERLALIDPDMLLVWQGGTPAHVVDELQNAGYEVRVLATNSLEDVAAAIVAIGDMAGRGETARASANRFVAELDSIASEYADSDAISVFYQVSRRPLFTVNGSHFVSQLISMCGGRNVFADLADLAPTIDVEAVVERDPEVILASSDAGDEPFAEWSRWPTMAANRNGNYYVMPADAIGRATPRLVEAARAVCDALDQARRRRESD